MTNTQADLTERARDLKEDADERRMFDEACRNYGGDPLRAIAGALTIWHKMAPEYGSYGKMLAIYANECARAADNRAAALHSEREAAAAEARRAAIEECAQVADRHGHQHRYHEPDETVEHRAEQMTAAAFISAQIRALASPPAPQEETK